MYRIRLLPPRSNTPPPPELEVLVHPGERTVEVHLLVPSADNSQITKYAFAVSPDAADELADALTATARYVRL